MSTFVAHHTNTLLISTFPRPSPNHSGVQSSSSSSLPHNAEKLQSLLLNLKPPLSSSILYDTVEALRSLESQQSISSANDDEEENALKTAILERLTVGFYAEALTSYLSQASEAETEAEWWSDIERSRRNAAWYLLQTLPARVLNLTRTILHTIHVQGLTVRPSLFTPSSLRRMLSSSQVLPNTLTTALFPHLDSHPHFAISVSNLSSFSVHNIDIASVYQRTLIAISRWSSAVLYGVTLPLEFTRQECSIKRKELEKIRDERAETLGALSGMRPSLEGALKKEYQGGRIGNGDKLVSFIELLQGVIQGQMVPTSLPSPTDEGFTSVDSDNLSRERYVAKSKNEVILSSISTLVSSTLPAHNASHATYLRSQALLRPSRLTLLWPRLFLAPPLILYGLRTAYASRASLKETAKQAWETVEGFWRGWLVEPIRDVVKTVRAGGEGGVIVRKEGVEADHESLERMVLALAREKLKYGQEQLEGLSRQIRNGDLTPVMQIYEEDIKSPVKSVVAGTLLRSAFIQVQKAKVDIDQALSGIDKLLKSQELTFAFVGVAPALAIVYIAGGAMNRLWTGGRGRGRYGGKKSREHVWVTMRRIERLLISQPKSSHPHAPSQRHSDVRSHPPSASSTQISPLTSGLLLLSLTHLRTYADKNLPIRSRLNEGFLQDVEDLEDPGLGRGEKLRVVERMWRCWGNVLGWERIGAI